MKLTTEEIEQGFKDLGLSNTKTCEALESLSRMTQPQTRLPRYETITTFHTRQEGRPVEPSDVELEPNS